MPEPWRIDPTRIKILGKIGGGTYGQVHAGRMEIEGGHVSVAVKTMARIDVPAYRETSAQFSARIKTEMQVYFLAQDDNNFVVRCYGGFFMNNTTVAIVLEKMGMSLHEFINKNAACLTMGEKVGVGLN